MLTDLRPASPQSRTSVPRLCSWAGRVLCRNGAAGGERSLPMAAWENWGLVFWIFHYLGYSPHFEDGGWLGKVSPVCSAAPEQMQKPVPSRVSAELWMARWPG